MVLDVLRSVADAWDVVGIVDADRRLHGRMVDGVPIVGDDSLLPRLRADRVTSAVVALGDNRLRGRLADTLKLLDFTLVSAVHPSAVVSGRATLGDGVVVMAGAVVNAGAAVGDNVIVNTCASIDHDSVLERDVHVAPGAHLGGCVRVGRGALIGIGATLVPGVVVGERAVVGAGAVVVRDVPAGVTVVGVPARVLARMTEESAP